MINKIIKRIEELRINHNTLIIGIDGRAASGKSTLASYLKDYFDATVFHVDDYFLPIERKLPSRLKEPGGNFDYERMEKELFHHLHDSNVSIRKFNCKTQELSHFEDVQLGNIIIIEGVYSLHPKFYPFYDLKIFLDVDKEEQLKRILNRSNETMLKRFQDEFLPLEELYFETTNLRSRVDIISEN